MYPLLTTLLNRFCRYKIGMSADISKMFREVGLHPSEYDFHRFLHWDKIGTIRDCRMKRLTLGVTSSPFLATKGWCQLAEDY